MDLQVEAILGRQQDSAVGKFLIPVIGGARGGAGGRVVGKGTETGARIEYVSGLRDYRDLALAHQVLGLEI